MSWSGLQCFWGHQLCKGCAGVSPGGSGQQSEMLLRVQCLAESLARQGFWGYFGFLIDVVKRVAAPQGGWLLAMLCRPC